MNKKNRKESLESTGDRTADFLLERGEFASPGVIDEIWEDIIDGAIDDQHAVMEKAGMLPPEWKETHEKRKRERSDRRAAKFVK